MDKKYIWQYLFAVILILFSLIFVLKNNNFKALSGVSLFDVLVSVFIALVIYSVSGLQYLFLLRRYNQTKLNLSDIFLLPIAMNLWSFIIPFQGALLYSTAILKFKYKIKTAESFSINIYSYLITIFIAGLIGMFFVIRDKMFFSTISIISLLFVLNPLIIFLLNALFQRWHIRQNNILFKIQQFLFAVVHNTKLLYEDLRTTLMVVLINIVHTLLSVIWYYWVISIFKINLSAISVIMLALLAKVSLILRLTPGNLGIDQLASGGLVVLLGGRAVDGVLVSLFITFTTILIVFSLGVLSTIYNMKYFQATDFKSIIKSLLKST